MIKKQIPSLLLLVFSAMQVFGQDTLKTVKVESTRKSLLRSLTITGNTTVMTSKELLKAACCNLAESFETNPSIDVNFSDALTGTRQIKMLGLTSPYLMITEENIPSVRGASQAYGLSFTPGTWVESIQVTKGAGSVVNGFESISGQINTELLKPLDDIPFFLNAYGSTDTRYELNTHFNKKISRNWATSLFLHGNTRAAKNDQNGDGFLDNPLGRQVNLINRWQYANQDSGLVSFFSVKYMNDEKQTGEVNYNVNRDKMTTNFWGSEIRSNRLDLNSKVGYVFKDVPGQSIGFQNAYSRHEQESYFGLNTYDITQSSYYSNFIFNSIIRNIKNKFATGLNFTFDQFQEFVNAIDYSRVDNSVGSFFEYTYDNQDNFSAVIGGRVDYHNRLGVFATPRLHLRYNPWANAVFRLSAGRGTRAANIFAENQQLFASSRQFEILDTNGELYGLNPEIAWNYGFSFVQKLVLLGRNADVGFDLYRTDFQSQAVVDLFESPQKVQFYNLNGKSYANSLQIDFSIEPVTRINLRTAYKYYDIPTDYISGRYQRPLQAKHRFFANVEYATPITEEGQQWRLDATANWFGKQQLPSTASNPEIDRLPDLSPSFSTFNMQVTLQQSRNFEMYFGGENIGNYRQRRAVLGAANPFGPNFDTSIIYAPVFGQMFYAGLRFKIR